MRSQMNTKMTSSSAKSITAVAVFALVSLADFTFSSCHLFVSVLVFCFFVFFFKGSLQGLLPPFTTAETMLIGLMMLRPA